MLTILTIVAAQLALGAKINNSMNFLDFANTLADSMGVDVENDQLAYEFTVPSTDSAEDTDDSLSFDQEALNEQIAEATEAAEEYFDEIAAAVEDAQESAEEYYEGVAAEREAAAADAEESAEESWEARQDELAEEEVSSSEVF